MERILRWTGWATAAGLGAVAAGLLVLLAYASSEVLAHPGISLIDGYQIGRLPWTAIGVDLAVLGATVVIVFGALTIWIGAGWYRRVISVLPLFIASFWWFVAMIPWGGAVPCDTCAPAGSDPLTFAYSTPEDTFLLLLLPAALIGGLAITTGRRRRPELAESAAGA